MKTPSTNAGFAAKIYAFTLLAGALCFIVHMSVSMVLNIATTTVLGLHTEGELGDGRTLVIEEYYAKGDDPEHRTIYVVGADDQKEILQDIDIPDPEQDDGAEELLKNYPVSDTRMANIRSETDPVMKKLANWIAQILMLILFLAFPYSDMWYTGDRDRNNVQFDHLAEDKLRGMKIGLMADIPAMLGWLMLFVSKLTGLFPGCPTAYRWMNVCFWPYLERLIPATVKSVSEVSLGAVFAMLPALFSLPLITGLGYFLGFKGFSLRDRLVYASTGKKPKHRRRK